MLALKDRVAVLDVRMGQHSLDLRAAREGPVDVNKLVFNPKMMAAIVGLVLSTWAGNWWISQRVTEKIEAVDHKVESMHQQMDANTKLQDERSNTMKAALDQQRADLKLYMIKVDDLATKLMVKGVIR